MVFSWLRSWCQGSEKTVQKALTRRNSVPARRRPELEALEDRLVPVTSVMDLTSTTVANLITTLVGSGVTVSNVTYSGSNLAAGIFSGGTASIGIGSGVVLSSGRATAAVGPNTTTATSNSLGLGGDADITALVGAATFDASVLEFDFVPRGNVISFRYVFGSDEYNEFVNFGVNDGFGFFLNGVNAALVPGTNIPISIDTVNSGLNSQYYVDNDFPAPASRNTSMDGFTTVLSVVLPVQQGQVNHIKLAIADGGDAQYDSWVMIEAGSLSASRILPLRPLRYVYSAATDTYDGNLTIHNATSTTLQGPLYLVISDLPPGVTLTNPTGFTSGGNPYLLLTDTSLGPRQTIRLPVTFTSAQNRTISSFYLAFSVDIVTVLP